MKSMMSQLLLAYKGPTHTVQNEILHLHVNKITDDIGEYTDLSIRALVYMNFEQQKSFLSVSMIAHVVSRNH